MKTISLVVLDEQSEIFGSDIEFFANISTWEDIKHMHAKLGEDYLFIDGGSKSIRQPPIYYAVPKCKILSNVELLEVLDNG